MYIDLKKWGIRLFVVLFIANGFFVISLYDKIESLEYRLNLNRDRFEEYRSEVEHQRKLERKELESHWTEIINTLDRKIDKKKNRGSLF